jgi:Protein of unknown function (DUF4232)
MSGRTRSVLAVCCALSALVAVPAGTSGAAPPRCSASHLSLEFVRQTAATSHRFLDLALRNTGTATCSLRGFPSVTLKDASAHVIGVRVDRVSGFAAHTVVLGPWHRAFFTFTFVDKGPCIPNFFSAYGLRVVAPHTTRHFVLYCGRFDVCSPSVGGNPGVYPLRSTLAGP